MPVVTTAVIAGAALAGQAALAAGAGGALLSVGGGLALGASIAGGAAGYYAGKEANKAIFGESDVLGDWIPGSLKGPKTPEPVTPDPLPQKGDEGIRSGETARIARKRTVGQLYLTRGQNRSDPSTLGGIKQQLG